ncbi:MAG: glycosyltransferase family 2 protein [Desulfuromonadales bacterium]|nr:glycosyltransferase family 2 protein [Desulfuromonadales bacterium]
MEIFHKTPCVSIVVPLFNEEDSIAPLINKINTVSTEFTFPFEIILVDDGSTDATWSLIKQYQESIPYLRAMKLRNNCGQTGAMVAGFDHSRGEIIVTMDGDLQNDPSDIPILLDKLEEGFDIVSGWRKDRKDHWSRVLPSKLANALISYTTGVHLHDYGCSLKAYRAECIRSLHCYGEMHRFFPALASMTGARVAEIPVQHHSRQFGTSKYGFSRIFKVFSDIFAINLLIRFSNSPLKGFVACSLPFALLGIGLGALAVLSWLFDWTEGKTFFFTVGSGLSLFGVVLMFSLGILGELAVGLSDLSQTRLIASTNHRTIVGGVPDSKEAGKCR